LIQNPIAIFSMNAKYRIAFKTLGCKLNQYETFAIRESALEKGYEVVPFNQVADVYVINTCTVTNRADYHSRQQIRKALRRNPDAFVVVCGCYSQVAAGKIAEITGVDLITGNLEKTRLMELIPNPPIKATSPRIIIEPVSTARNVPSTRLTQFGGLTRAFVKIQDGCDYRCAYCVVPIARGPSRSKPMMEIVGEVERFASVGFGEVVLTGVHLGCWGRDIGEDFADLLRKLVNIENLHRLRLSSIEPVDMTDELIEFILNEPKICRHLHLPLQSGHPGTLTAMGRPYTPFDYAAIVSRIKTADPGWCIGADVIVGFPGEGNAEFGVTYDFIESIPLSYLHVFTFSTRPGTRASDMAGQVPHPVRDERNRMLKELSRRKRADFAKGQFGVQLELLIENRRDPKTGKLVGLSDNYLRVLLDGPDGLSGKFVKGLLTGFLPDREMGLGRLISS
jgi:threonylcarbamoyladenosine tRNA methylthiotransferase MtaB